MKTQIMRLTALVYALAMPVIAFAQEHAEEHGGGHGEHGWDTNALAASFVNFFLLIAVFVVCTVTLRRMMAAKLASR